VDSINIKEKFSKFSKNWHPHQIAIVDDMQVLLAKIKGQFVWHQHEKEDELFQVIKGCLEMHFRDRIEIVNEGEIIVVPKGVEHCPVTKDGEEVQVLLFEKLSTAHTGTIKHEKTISNYPKLDIKMKKITPPLNLILNKSFQDMTESL
jgi:mannose-6-phosphate isomerase-like protein (cupin superfamily)